MLLRQVFCVEMQDMVHIKFRYQVSAKSLADIEQSPTNDGIVDRKENVCTFVDLLFGRAWTRSTTTTGVKDSWLLPGPILLILPYSCV